MPACFHAPHYDVHVLEPPGTMDPQIKHFLLEVALVMVFYPGNRIVTKTHPKATLCHEFSLGNPLPLSVSGARGMHLTHKSTAKYYKVIPMVAH